VRKNKKDIVHRLFINKIMHVILLGVFTYSPLMCQEYSNNLLKKDFYTPPSGQPISNPTYSIEGGFNVGTIMQSNISLNAGTSFPTEKNGLIFPLQTLYSVNITSYDRYSRTGIGAGTTYRTTQYNFSSSGVVKAKQNDDIFNIGYRSDVLLSNKYLGVSLYYEPILTIFGKNLSADLNIEYMFSGDYQNTITLDNPVSSEFISKEKDFTFSDNGKKAAQSGELPKGASRWLISLSANYFIWGKTIAVLEDEFRGTNYIHLGVDAKLGVQFFSMYSSGMEVAPSLSLNFWLSIPTRRL